jgi:hypothetical protein
MNRTILADEAAVYVATAADDGFMDTVIDKCSPDSDTCRSYCAVALGLGMISGCRRVVGERIGKGHLTYMQGASVELVAAITISAADRFGLWVSTTPYAFRQRRLGDDEWFRRVMEHRAPPPAGRDADLTGIHCARH